MAILPLNQQNCQPNGTMNSKPWWERYRKRKYKPRSRLSLEMILRKSFVETVKEYTSASSIAGMRHITDSSNCVFQRLVSQPSIPT